MNEIISALIILFSVEGTSLDKTKVCITSKNIDKFVPPLKSMKKVANYFESRGFLVTSGDINISITGSSILFQKMFKIKIQLSKHPQTGDTIVISKHELLIPKELRNDISKIIFPDAPIFFN